MNPPHHPKPKLNELDVRAAPVIPSVQRPEAQTTKPVTEQTTNVSMNVCVIDTRA